MPKDENKPTYPQTWYKVDGEMNTLDIVPVTVHRETPTKVEIMDSRHRFVLVPKGNDYHKYFPTEADAVEWIIGKLAKNILDLDALIKRTEESIVRYADSKAKAERRLEAYTESIKNNVQSNLV